MRFAERPGHLPGVDALWVRTPGAAAVNVIAADGCVDVIVREAADGSLAASLYVPTTRAITTAVAAGERVSGARLGAGFGGRLVGDPAVAPLVLARIGRGVPLEDVVGELLDRIGHPPALIRDFVAEAHARRGDARVDALCPSAAAERRLEREARRWLALTPKGYLRIVRAHAARAAIVGGLGLADVAAELGLADQAHLTRELRAVLGRAARRVRAEAPASSRQRTSADSPAGAPFGAPTG